MNKIAREIEKVRGELLAAFGPEPDRIPRGYLFGVGSPYYEAWLALYTSMHHAGTADYVEDHSIWADQVEYYLDSAREGLARVRACLSAEYSGPTGQEV